MKLTFLNEKSYELMKRFVGNIKFNRKLSLVQKMVFCDAISSSGKGMLSHIISSFKNVELQRNDYIYERWLKYISLIRFLKMLLLLY